MKIVKINGFKGLITAIFMAVCLFAGFVIFPGQVSMYLWNKYLVTSFMFPQLNLLQGVLLWTIAVLSYSVLFKKGFQISFDEPPSLSDADLDRIMKKAKIHTKMNKINNFVNKPEAFEKSPKDLVSPEKDLTHVSSPISLKNNETKEEEPVSNLK